MSETATVPATTETAGEHHDSAHHKKRERRRRQQHNPSPRPPEPALNIEELTELVALIANHGFTEFELEREGFRVRLRRELAPQIIAAPAPAAPVIMHTPAPSAPLSPAETHHAPPAPPHPGAQAEKAASADENLEIIPAPIVGTFYRTPSPAAEPFVRIGSKVTPSSVVCIIEAMKLMNEIPAETNGEIAKIYVENGQPVEFGQPLFGLKK